MKTKSKQFTIHIPNFSLHHGEQSGEFFVRCSLFGSIDLPIVAVLGGISASHLVANDENGSVSGWWKDVVNQHEYLNGKHVSVLSFEYITLQNNQTKLSTFDQAHVLASIHQQLNINPFLSVIGSSYGGMVAQAFTSTYPQLTQSLVCLVAAHKNSLRSQALRLIQRQILLLENNNINNIALARALAIMTYRGVDEFDHRFETLAEVESYLEHNGLSFAKRFSANRYLQLSASIDEHQINPSNIKVPTLLIAIDSDQLVPVLLIKAFADGIKARCQCHIISSAYGHDGFLKEFNTFNPILSDFLAKLQAELNREQHYDKSF